MADEKVAMELNPNHPSTRGAHDNWHKIVAMIMHQRGLKRIQITVKDVERFSKDYSGSAVTIRFDDTDGITLTLISMEEAEKLARKEGGLPC